MTTLGALAGVGWQLLSVACLRRLLDAWLQPRPSTWRVVAWLALKIGLVLMLAAGLAAASTTFLVGFSVGFTVAMVLVIGWCARHSRQASQVHGD